MADNVVDMSELIQYIVVNKDLNMSPGKVAAQVGHVCTYCAYEEGSTDKFIEWYRGIQKKIILGAHEKVLKKLEKDFYAIHDVGCNEVEPDSLTAVSLGILPREEAKPFIKGLQLYK